MAELRPDHYGGAGSPYETIKVLRATMSDEEFMGFCKGNIIKYAMRLGHKESDNPETVLTKIATYANFGKWKGVPNEK